MSREASKDYGASVDHMLDTLQATRRKMGLVGLSEEEADHRIQALLALPIPAYEKIFREPSDDKRESMICAVMRANESFGVVYKEEPVVEKRMCALSSCSAWFRVAAQRPNQKYCCDLHRKMGVEEWRK